MKKIIALVLALMMVLCAVSALAADSKSNNNIGNGTVVTGNEKTEEEVKIVKVGDTAATKAIKDAVTAAFQGGNVLDAFPDAVKAQLPEDAATVNEMDTYQLDGDVSGMNSLTLVFKFETPYPEGEEVTVLLIIPAAEEGGEAEWITLKGKANADGDVVVTVDAATLAKVQNNPFVVIPVSK